MFNTREKLIDLLYEAEGLVNNELPTVEMVADYLLGKDVTIPVRCKCCKYKGRLLDANERLYCCNYHSKGIMFENLYVSENDYCSAGKEKDNG